MPEARADRFLPLTSLDFQVLALLASRTLHGYAIIQAAHDAFPGQPALEIGSLYRIISRMVHDRLLREVHAVDAPHDQRVRHFYEATELGRAVARAEARRLESLLASAAALRLVRGTR